MPSNWTRNLQAIASFARAATLNRDNLVIAQLHGPLFVQFAQLSLAASVAAHSDRDVAIDTYAYDYFRFSPDITKVVDLRCRKTRLEGITFKRLGDPLDFGGADWRRVVKSRLAPTMVGVSETAAAPARGTIVLHGLPPFAMVAQSGAMAGKLFGGPIDNPQYDLAHVVVSGSEAFEQHGKIDIDGERSEMFLTDATFPSVFRSVLNSKRVRTNSAEVAHWISLIRPEASVDVLS